MTVKLDQDQHPDQHKCQVRTLDPDQNKDRVITHFSAY
jgi:hypothetical protein